MASATLRQCPGPGCANVTTGGPCPSCARRKNARHGSSSSRGYGARWRRFLGWWKNRLARYGGVLVCGATHPGGPVTNDSECKRLGRLNATSLQFDHEPPLTDDERQNENAVCDALRIQVLCATCHSRKTMRERGRVRA